MRDRRFIINGRVPSTLADDDEALQFFAEGLWREMLERAGGVPAEDPMVRAILGNDHTPSQAGLITFVDIHIIGYARPAIEVEIGFDGRMFETSLDALIQGLVGARANMSVPAGTIRALDGDGDEVDVWDDDDDPWDSITSGGGDIRYVPPSRDAYNTVPQDDEGWGDAMRWTPGEGKTL